MKTLDVTEIEYIDSLSDDNYPHTRHIQYGYDMKAIPDATPENMQVMMLKINELIDCVNKLMSERLNRIS